MPGHPFRLTTAAAISPARPNSRVAGFTLIEMLVVLAILAASLFLLSARGPARSAALDLRASAEEVAGSLRLARARSIEAGSPVLWVLDGAAHGYRLGAEPPHRLLAALAVSAQNVDGSPARGVRFAPDGSASGGRVVLALGTRRAVVGVNWLTGRVSVAIADAQN